MPRKPLIYTHENPYHIRARSNNKEWFYLPISECWNIFAANLNHIHLEYGFSTHLFVLMNNHYHLIGTCSEKHNLGEVMAWFQKSISRTINSRAGRINHVFGGAHKASLIHHPSHFADIYKYVARNPISAGICERNEDYPYSTLTQKTGARIITKSAEEWAAFIPKTKDQMNSWINTDFEGEAYQTIKMNLSKTVFTPKDRSRRKEIITQLCYQK